LNRSHLATEVTTT